MTGTKPRAAVPHPPRLAASLAATDGPLGEDRPWEGIEAGPTALVQSPAADSEVTGCRLRGVRFTGAELHRLRLVDVVLDNCDLSGTVAVDATLVRVAFTGCRLSGLVAHSIKGQDVLWSDCKLDGANFRAANFDRIVWQGCILSEGDFYRSKLSSCHFDHV